jgi:hypothetical protein
MAICAVVLPARDPPARLLNDLQIKLFHGIDP